MIPGIFQDYRYHADDSDNNELPRTSVKQTTISREGEGDLCSTMQRMKKFKSMSLGNTMHIVEVLLSKFLFCDKNCTSISLELFRFLVNTHALWLINFLTFQSPDSSDRDKITFQCHQLQYRYYCLTGTNIIPFHFLTKRSTPESGETKRTYSASQFPGTNFVQAKRPSY